MRIRFWLMSVLALASTLSSGMAHAVASDTDVATKPTYLQSLQQAARQQGLARSAMWRTLLHYSVQPITRVDRSLADDPDFFLAQDGAHNPEHELDATLAAFFNPSAHHALDQPATCRFIARYQWLDAQLHFDAAQLPTPDCPRYTQWRQGIKADRATLIFPSAYVNSPASMYGHTFIRLDAQPAPGQTWSPMLSYAVSYAANGNEADGLAFAFKGLTGLYAGQFTNEPYYLRIRDYNDLENRDIWEYELNLTPAEIDRLLAHAWELGPTRFDYYFFDENCSYHLLSLLDAARPELQLTQQFTWWAIPLDTVRAVTQTPGLLTRIQYRPSNSTELRYRANLLGPQRARLAQQLSDETLTPQALAQHEPSPEQRALILETAERLVSYEATRKDSTEAATQKQRMALLAARASLPAGTPVTVPTPIKDPTQGHDTARVDVMLGQRQGQGLVMLQARPAYHDLMDPEDGYQRGAAIQFFNVAFTKAANGHAQLESFTPMDISSISPQEPLMASKSWRVHIGLERSLATRADGTRPLGINLRGGPGLATELTPGQHWLGYAFMDNQARWDRTLPQQPWAVGSGIALGLLGDLNAQWRVQTEAFARAYLDKQPFETGLLVRTRYSLNAQWNLHAQCETTKRRDVRVNQSCLLGVQRYL